jgi:hypothetical protein
MESRFFRLAMMLCGLWAFAVVVRPRLVRGHWYLKKLNPWAALPEGSG